MKKEDDLVKVYVGTEASCLLLKDRLEQIGISALIKNDSSSAFLVTAPEVVDLYIQESDLNTAGSAIKEVIKNR